MQRPSTTNDGDEIIEIENPVSEKIDNGEKGDSEVASILTKEGESEGYTTQAPSACPCLSEAFASFKAKHEQASVYLEFMCCFVALQVSYLTWGLMQEMIMKPEYEKSELNPSGKFPSAMFCVFGNRLFAIIVSASVTLWRFGTFRTAVPLWWYTPCALSNVLSSWAQYASLGYVPFSLQTIFKSMKIIPVMAMGMCLNGTRYSLRESLEAVSITIGVVVFSTSTSGVFSPDTVSFAVIVGFCLLCMYVICDAFTPQWQSRLYRKYGKIDSFQMMFGVNVSSIFFTSIALVVSGDIPLVIEFFQQNPSVFYYNIASAITSTTGQVAIFYTIKRFGPIAFTIIMTTRQMVSIFISNAVFNHVMSAQSYLGFAIVFGTTAAILYRKHTNKKAPEEKTTLPK